MKVEGILIDVISYSLNHVWILCDQFEIFHLKKKLF